ncbi:uncharacterized mitochondrial protein AtMg00240-like [Gossypium hirsutum]|uniref:Uncharacterized mitochondrial protein AtMg00240-like n=1 Tax=Gossypium hirsutum TaxID=3635 RepID=A0A1U8JVW7_GOSHI|nr:uncharacterized mitochondrial protein AtMg00240-like [Gossypium hirsutum]
MELKTHRSSGGWWLHPEQGDLKYFIGIEVARSNNGIILNQRKYSMGVNSRVYQRLLRRLLYLTNTRLDISFAVQHLSQFMHKPKKYDLEAILRVVRYIKKNPGQGILLSMSGKSQMFAYCDSDWATCPMSRRSITGFCVKL